MLFIERIVGGPVAPAVAPVLPARELQSAQSGPAPALSRGRPGHTAIAEEGLSPLRTALDLADPGRVGPWPIPTAHEGSATNVEADAGMSSCTCTRPGSCHGCHGLPRLSPPAPAMPLDSVPTSLPASADCIAYRGPHRLCCCKGNSKHSTVRD